MDTQRDYLPFRTLIARLCETMGKPCTDELIESWWKALRNASITAVEARIDAFIAKADEGTRFPRPAQIRPPETVAASAEPNPYGESWLRGYWRTAIMETLAHMTGQTVAALQPIIVAKRETVGRQIRELMDEMQERETRTGQRTPGHDEYAQKACLEIARAFGLCAEWRSGFGA